MVDELEDAEPPQGVIVCVRVRPMAITRDDGSPGREAHCTRIVEMEGQSKTGIGCAVTQLYDPENMGAAPRVFAFDRSYWSCDEFEEDPERPGVSIPADKSSKYVSQEMIWSDLGQVMMKNVMKGYNCTLFAYGQTGAGKSYTVVGSSANAGLIPNTISALFQIVREGQRMDVRFHVEIAMLEVYMGEVYDLLEPRKKERDKLKVFLSPGEVHVYDPKDRRNLDKIWRATRDFEQADRFRRAGDANRTVRSTNMNPSSSRGHTVFMLRFRKQVKAGNNWIDQICSKITLVDLAGSERAHDTGLTGIGLEEGISINQSLTALGQVLVSLCKRERVNYRDKLTQVLSDALSGNAVTIMVAAVSPADVNYGDTLSTLRFADNAKKMPVKLTKQLNSKAQLVADLREENERLQAQLAATCAPEQFKMALQEKDLYSTKLQEADTKLANMHKEFELMQVKVQQGERMRIATLTFRHEDQARLEQLDDEISRLQGDVAHRDVEKADMERKLAELEEKLKQRSVMEAAAQQAAQQELKNSRAMMEQMAVQMEQVRAESDHRVAELQAEMEALRQEAEQAESDCRVASLQAEMEAESNRRVAEMQGKMETLRLQAQRVQQEKQAALEEEMKRSEQQLQAERLKFEAEQAQMAELQRQLEELRAAAGAQPQPEVDSPAPPKREAEGEAEMEPSQQREEMPRQEAPEEACEQDRRQSDESVAVSKASDTGSLQALIADGEASLLESAPGEVSLSKANDTGSLQALIAEGEASLRDSAPGEVQVPAPEEEAVDSGGEPTLLQETPQEPASTTEASPLLPPPPRARPPCAPAAATETSARPGETPETSRLEDLAREVAAAEENKRWATEQSKEFVEHLLQSSLAEIEELVDALKEALVSLECSGDIGVSDIRQETVHMLEDALTDCRNDYQELAGWAERIGVGHTFRAAALALERDEREAKARAASEEVRRLRAKLQRLQGGEAGRERPHRTRAEIQLESALGAAIAAEQDAMKVALHIAEEASLAAGAALEERRLELQQLTEARDEVQKEAAMADERWGPTEDELRERQLMIQALLLRQEDQEKGSQSGSSAGFSSWEGRLRVAAESEARLKKGFEEMGRDVGKIFSNSLGSGFRVLGSGVGHTASTSVPRDQAGSTKESWSAGTSASFGITGDGFRTSAPSSPHGVGTPSGVRAGGSWSPGASGGLGFVKEDAGWPPLHPVMPNSLEAAPDTSEVLALRTRVQELEGQVKGLQAAKRGPTRACACM